MHRSFFLTLLSLFLVPVHAGELKDIAYGDDPAQRLDVYSPQDARHAPIIVMVHGGAWRVGDKNARSVVRNKVDRWVPQGFIFVSINYRMLPQAEVPTQAIDVARALAFVQAKAQSWGGNPDKVILMGHSAGAHLAALLSSNPALATKAGAHRWLGTVSLDSAALDVPAVMQKRHLPLYDKAFGSNPHTWESVSPLHVLATNAVPLLAVCSSIRRDQPCRQTHAYANKATSLRVRSEVLEQPLSHGEINGQLGTAGAYTSAVEAFLASLDSGIAAQLSQR